MGGTGPREEPGAWFSLFLWGYQWGQTLPKSPIPLGVPDKDERDGIGALRTCALVQATSTPDPAPVTGKEETDTPWPPEAAVEGGLKANLYRLCFAVHSRASRSASAICFWDNFLAICTR